MDPCIQVCHRNFLSVHTDKEVAAMVDSRSQHGDHLVRHSVAVR